MKLNTLLAATDTLRVKYKNLLEDYAKFFATKQGAFLGRKDTYTPKADAIDEPSKRKYVKVQTTVDEKIEYFIKNSTEFIDSLFSQEKTNAIGLAKAVLVVEGEAWGEFTSLELLRLKSLLESADLGKLESILISIPVRSDSEIWSESFNPDYVGKNIWETDLVKGVARTSVKEEYILEDPNLSKLSASNYTPKTSMRTTVQEIGDYTSQEFSGQWSHRQRAGTLERRNNLILAVAKALKESNECEAVSSDLTAKKIFGYIFKG